MPTVTNEPESLYVEEAPTTSEYATGVSGTANPYWYLNPQFTQSTPESKKFHVCEHNHLLRLFTDAEVNDKMHRGDSIYTFYAADELSAQDTFDLICIGWGLRVQS